MAGIIFKENQKIKKVYIWLVTVISILLLLATSILPFIENIDSKGIWLTLIVIIGTFALLASIKMQIRIDQKKLMFRYIPFINTWKTYSFHEIQEMKLIKYNSLLQYGGWGIRYNFDSWLYNTGGNYGIKVKVGKKKFILGTYKPEEAEIAISQYRTYKNPDQDAK